MQKKGLVFVISGPSGSGKGTIVGELRRLYPDVGLSISATTRAPRAGETDGVEYHFKTREEFRRLLSAGEILEHTEYNGNYYGTLRTEADRVIAAGKDLILEIEVDGAGQVKRLLGENCVLIMLMPPNAAELERRLRERGTESEDVICGRLAKARAEIAMAPQYEYVVVNETGRQEECARTLLAILQAAHAAYARMRAVPDSFFDNL